MNYLQLSYRKWRKIALICLLFVAFVYIERAYAATKIDSSFYPVIDGDGIIYASAIQSNGKILVGGNISKPNGEKLSAITRLNSDGRIDLSFNPSFAAGTIRDIKVLND